MGNGNDEWIVSGESLPLEDPEEWRPTGGLIPLGEPEPSLFEKAGRFVLGEQYEPFAEAISTPVYSKPGDEFLQIGKKVASIAGPVGARIGEGIIGAAKGLYDVTTGPYTKELIENSDFVKSQMRTLKGAKEAIGKIGEAYPEETKFLGDVLNASMLNIPRQIIKGLTIPKGLPLGRKVINPIDEAVSGERLFVEPPMNWVEEQSLSQSIKPKLEKTILTTGGKKTAKDVEQYLLRGADSVEDIVKNKANIKFETPDGELIEGRLPKNYSEWKDAIYQREGDLFKQYDAMSKEATGKGAAIDLNPLAEKLESFASDKVIMTENPLAAKYAGEKAALYRNAGSYTADEAQQALVELNKKFEAFMKSPSPEKAIDVISGNNIRQNLYDSIMQYEGPGYEQLRRAFGAHKTIETDVTKKAIAELKKTSKLDWIDLLSGAEFGAGLITLNPYMMARGGMYEGLKRGWKWYNSPQRAIKNMFSDADKSLSRNVNMFREAPTTEPPMDMRFLGDAPIQPIGQGVVPEVAGQAYRGNIAPRLMSTDARLAQAEADAMASRVGQMNIPERPPTRSPLERSLNPADDYLATEGGAIDTAYRISPQELEAMRTADMMEGAGVSNLDLPPRPFTSEADRIARSQRAITGDAPIPYIKRGKIPEITGDQPPYFGKIPKSIITPGMTKEEMRERIRISIKSIIGDDPPADVVNKYLAEIVGDVIGNPPMTARQARKLFKNIR